MRHVPVVIPELDGEEEKHACSLHRALDVLDELVVIVCFWSPSASRDNGGLASLPPPITTNPPNAAASHAVTYDPEDIGKIRTAGLV